MKKIALLFTLIFCFSSYSSFSQDIALLKYKGGGDWYANPTALKNLIAFCNQNISTKITSKPQEVEVGSPDIFQYPFLHMTGHGNVFFSETEAENLHDYLVSGGFIHIDDNYGMQPYITKELIKVFPDKALVELPSSHKLFNMPYKFPEGLPKIHEHEGKRPQAFGIFHEERLVLLFTVESDLGDGWEDADIHNDPADVREKALKMGANIVKYAFEN